MSKDIDMESKRSELEYSVPRPDATRLDSNFNASANNKSLAQTASTAVKTLESIDIPTVLHDASSHWTIQQASTSILDFLDSVIEGHIAMEDSEPGLAAFAGILNPSCLSMLFEYRVVFYSVAAEALTPGTSSAVTVCWVDSVLAKLGEAVFTVAGGANTADSRFNILSRQREADNIRASAQLPQKWRSVPAVIADERASPAAKRLAVRLTFAVYTMGPQLLSRRPWCENDVHPKDMLAFLQISLDQLSLNSSLGNDLAHDASVRALHDQENATRAMLVSLYASSEIILHGTDPTALPSPFRPHTTAFLLRVIQSIIHPDDAVSDLALTAPCEELNVAQSILLKWGGTVPWCWRTWGDRRVAEVESIIYLTVTWLYHLESALNSHHVKSTEMWAERLASCLFQDPTAASTAILQIFHHSVLYFSSSRPANVSPSMMNVLFKSCWAATQFYHSTAANDRQVEPSKEIARYLCGLFALAGNCPLELHSKELIIESLTLIGPETVRSGLKEVTEDTGIRFAITLDQLISRLTRVLLDDTSCSEGDLCAIKLLLKFFTIVWNSATWCFHFHSISFFFKALIKRLSVEPSVSAMLLGSLLTSLVALELFKRQPFSKDVSELCANDMVWRLVMTTRRSDIFVAGSLAQYVCMTAGHPVSDAIGCVETWDYLRDTCLLILTHQILGDDEPLALIILPSICQALAHLSDQADPIFTTFIRSSPWTTTLCANLQTFLSDGSDFQQTQYYAVLAKGLASTGLVLLNQVKKLHSTTEQIPRQNFPPHEPRLMFFRAQPVSRLMFVA